MTEFDDYAANYDALLKDPIRDRFARGAGFFHWRKWRLLQDFLRRAGAREAGLEWLDIGCGRGELLRFGQGHFAQVVGCDPSERMLEECAGLSVELQTQPALLPFPDCSFDVATAACVYHHLNPQERRSLTREASRILRPGGVFVIFEHNPWNPVTRLIVSRTPVDANAVLLTAVETRRMLRDAGFSGLSTSYYLYFPEGLFARFALVERSLAAVPAGGQYAVFGRLRS